MKGTVYKRVLPSGRVCWELQVDAGRDETGKRLRVVRGGFDRKCDAETELTRLLQEKNEGLLVKPDPRTFSEFMDEWFREHAEKHCQPKTVERYRQLAGYVLPQIGHVALRDLSTLMLERVFNRLKDTGGQKKRRLKRGEKPEAAPLSARTVKNVADLVRGALGTALRWQLLKTNPATACELPKVVKREARALDPAETEWFLDGARGTWLYPFLMTEAATGARRGELLALAWSDLLIESVPALMTISKSLEQTKQGLRIKPTKTEKPRTVPLPAIAVEALKEHRQRQAVYREQYGPDYRTDLNLVFATPEGEHLKPDSVTSKASALAKKLGLKGVCLHSLRHSHGSQLLSAGVPLPAVSKRLGHSSVYVTATVYSHALPQDELAAADIWDATMRKVNQDGRAKQ
jgi:integrase